MKVKSKDDLIYRPHIHFSPRKNWMNDPNGMFYYKGKYHLFFQYHPNSNVWGPMHWGHAISKNLIHWEEQPIALFPDRLGDIFSGSAVVDHKNTSGFGTIENPPIVAIYTNHDSAREKKGSKVFQTQSIAYSLDEGQTWKKFIANPVIKNPGIRDFRDPKVIWYEREQKWILILAASQTTQFYESKDLKQWTYLSSFGQGIGNHDGVWECPDFFELTVEGDSEKKWVHLVSINPGGPNGGSSTQYFVGNFDGKQFVPDSNFEAQMKITHDFWIDFGKDNYAGVTYFNWDKKKSEVLYQGWMSNWQYASLVPTNTWRGTMTIPRELQLYLSDQKIYRLKSKVFSELEKFTIKILENDEQIIKGREVIIEENTVDLSNAKVEIQFDKMEQTRYTFILFNNQGDSLSFGYDHGIKKFFIDRSNSGHVDFSNNFSAKPSEANRLINSDSLKVLFILDKTSIELFYDEGITAMTEIFFPRAPYTKMALQFSGSKTRLKGFKVHEIKK